MDEEYIQILDNCDSELNEIKEWIKSNPVDSKIRYLNAYAVVRCSGAIELALKKMIYDWLSENAKDDAKTYLGKMIVDSSSNPSTGIMNRFLEYFNQNKKNRFDKVLKDSLQDKANLNSLVQWRNDVAHGRSISSSINTVYSCFVSGKTILEKYYAILRSER